MAHVNIAKSSTVNAVSGLCLFYICYRTGCCWILDYRTQVLGKWMFWVLSSGLNIMEAGNLASTDCALNSLIYVFVSSGSMKILIKLYVYVHIYIITQAHTYIIYVCNLTHTHISALTYNTHTYTFEIRLLCCPVRPWTWNYLTILLPKLHINFNISVLNYFKVVLWIFAYMCTFQTT